jgi:predicted flap endonuclease-1-like 5' DNA nuclease
VQATEPPATPSPTPVPSTEVPAESVFTQIRGISDKRAAQLKEHGITTYEQLANASADELAAKLGVSPKIVKMWIGSAKKLTK